MPANRFNNHTAYGVGIGLRVEGRRHIVAELEPGSPVGNPEDRVSEAITYGRFAPATVGQ